MLFIYRYFNNIMINKNRINIILTNKNNMNKPFMLVIEYN